MAPTLSHQGCSTADQGPGLGPPTSRAVWAALESPITATAAPTSTTSLPATPRCSSSGGCERDLRSEKTPGIEVGNDTHPDPEVFHDTP